MYFSLSAGYAISQTGNLKKNWEGPKGGEKKPSPKDLRL